MSAHRSATKKFGKTFKLIPEDEVPIQLKRSSQQWLMLLRRIPEGQALTGTEDELGIKASSAKIALARLKKAGLLGKNYYVTVKTTEGTRTVYFVHSAKPIEE